MVKIFDMDSYQSEVVDDTGNGLAVVNHNMGRFTHQHQIAIAKNSPIEAVQQSFNITRPLINARNSSNTGTAGLTGTVVAEKGLKRN